MIVRLILERSKYYANLKFIYFLIISIIFVTLTGYLKVEASS